MCVGISPGSEGSCSTDDKEFLLWLPISVVGQGQLSITETGWSAFGRDSTIYPVHGMGSGGKEQVRSCCVMCAAELLSLYLSNLTKGLDEVLERQMDDSLQSQMRSLAGAGGRD